MKMAAMSLALAGSGQREQCPVGAQKRQPRSSAQPPRCRRGTRRRLSWRSRRRPATGSSLRRAVIRWSCSSWCGGPGGKGHYGRGYRAPGHSLACGASACSPAGQMIRPRPGQRRSLLVRAVSAQVTFAGPVHRGTPHSRRPAPITRLVHLRPRLLAESWPGGRPAPGTGQEARVRTLHVAGQPPRGELADPAHPLGTGGRRTLVPSGWRSRGYRTGARRGWSPRPSFRQRSVRSLQPGGEQRLTSSVVHVQPAHRSPRR
jgi:hypothetical protein